MAAIGTIEAAMDALVALENTVHTDLRVYRWRPTGNLELPAVYNWLSPSRFEQRDLAEWDDWLALRVIVAVRNTDTIEEMDRLETYADFVRDTIDSAFHQNPPLADTVIQAFRRGLNVGSDKFGDVDVRTFEFPIELRIGRVINPT